MSSKSKKIERLGEESYNNQGLHMKIIRYGANNDIDIIFDDGVVVYHKTYKSFQNGAINNPNAQDSRIKSRLGEEKTNNQGLNMKIIDYRRSDDIDVQFDDGYISKNRTTTSFDRGMIENPNYNRTQMIDMVGEKIGRLLVIERGEDYIIPKTQKHVVRWVCLCDCGNIVTVAGGCVKRKKSNSVMRMPTKRKGC